MQKLTFILFLSLVLTTLSTSVSSETPGMWGDLVPGRYQVGFRTVFAYDLSRPAVPYADWNGQLYALSPQPGRQMQVNLWYPARIDEDAEALQFDYYVGLMARQTDFAPLDADRKRLAEAQFVTKTNALGGNGSFDLSKLGVLLKLTTAAHLDASSAPGRFPVIVFPNGGSPAFQSIMSEYFASHGFVVVSAALKGQHSSTEDISAKGLETAVDDLGFAIQTALQLDFADPERVCLMGNAITSSHIVAYQSRNERIGCLVSLDGGLLSRFEQRLLKQTLFYEPQAVNRPILAIYAPHDAIDPRHIDHLQFARRYLVHFPQMSEFHFLNYGAFEQFVPGIIGTTQGNVRRGFELAALYCLKFFEAHLQGNNSSERFLSQAPPPFASGHVTQTEIRPALPSPPTVARIKNGFLTEGFDHIHHVYHDLKSKNPQPFPESFYVALKDWLAWKKDPQFENRYQLYSLALDSYPNSARVNFELAHFALKTSRYAAARTLNQETLRLLENGSSDEVTDADKTAMMKYVKIDLDVLDSRAQ